MNKEKLKPKLFSVMKTYTKEQFLKDVVAGIIVAIIALPLSIALALASGVGPEEGIYTAIIAGFLISFLGGSRVQIASRDPEPMPQPLQRSLRGSSPKTEWMVLLSLP